MRQDKISNPCAAAHGHHGPSGPLARRRGPGTGQGVQLDLKVMPESEKPEKETQPKPEPAEISMLINSVYYLLETVFILNSPEIDGYILFVIGLDGKIITDNIYKSAAAARKAFVNIYSHKARIDGVKPHWSPWYSPDSDWLDEKLSAEPLEKEKVK